MIYPNIRNDVSESHSKVCFGFQVSSHKKNIFFLQIYERKSSEESKKDIELIETECNEYNGYGV